MILAAMLAASPVLAEEWHEAYRAGVRALARAEPERAVAALKRAVGMRPEPGRNLVTYGTNIEPRYFPYLGLAEAYLALGQHDLARDALQTSARWQREPADERLRLQARLDSALEARRAPPATAGPPAVAAPLAPTSPPASTLLAPVATPPAASAAPTSLPAIPSAAPGAAARASAARPAREPVREPAASLPPPPAAPASASLEIVTQPPGGTAYLDDEALGSSDPQTGRLLKTGLRPGRHRVRVEIAGHEPTLGEIDVAAGGSVSFHAAPSRLTPTPAGGPGPGWLGFGVVALALIAAVSWMVLRHPADPAPLWTATPPARRVGAVPDTPTPREQANPGARRDAQGQEWFGEFRLLEILGRGGMASVYKAARGAEVVALKRPLSGLLDDPDFLERFLREAEIGRTLNHPAIVRILGRGDVEGVPYFTMELLGGQTLQALVKSGAHPDPRGAAAIVVQAAEALDFAHGKGVIHRDLKPSNIMLLPDGGVKVMDFGIARAERLEGMTATGAFLGTPDYIAPELIEGGRAEPRSDLYSLGVVFYELLTGQRPFSGETAFVILKKHVAESPTPPSLVRRGIPDELDGLVRRLLAKRPEERPASAEELVVGLRDWLNRAV